MTQVTDRLCGKARSLGQLLAGRTVWVCALFIALCSIMLFVSQQVKLVYIRDANTTILRHTLQSQPEHILSESGITTMAFDVVDFSGFHGKIGVINIDRAFPVSILVDGREYHLMTTEISVRELLQQQYIRLGPQDKISLPTSFYVSENDRIVINRIEGSTSSEYVEVPFETEYRQTPLLRKGRTRVLTYGQNGRLLRTYDDTMMDGELAERKLLSEEVIKQPVTQVVLVGADVPVSKLDFGVALDENGNPKHYKTVYRNQVATGYYAGNSAYGASLMYLEAGFVAVRTNQFPYGTKLYIKSADNSFVYGYAIAADTGVGLINGVIDVDLYYDTYLESCLNGRKSLDIYVLDEQDLTKPFVPKQKKSWFY